MKRMIGNKEYDLSKQTLVMGIINVTPDSFSDGGSYANVEAAVKQAQKLASEGADILDIGGESTRPGYEPVSADEEIARVVPAIQAIREVVDLPISIDTYKAKTAEAAIEAGASIINDIWGAKYDADMANVAARLAVPIILMHNREEVHYNDLLPDMIADLEESIQIAIDAGVKRQDIWLDPGIGFVKSFDENMAAMRELDKITAMGYPVLLGTSRKRFIGTVLDLPADQRDEGTAATTAFGISKGIHMVRVHEVKQTARIVKMMDALVRKE
ncbi:dihydropteroate synthase [Terribacillus saccharophilus]|uniref:dihydropteroate synthase n=1 Tax=Terribacillus saccharophilus TaxID=361277 RepID=UPI000BA660AA|nr:dihydropteroate synthase [Terribacillus saccharophilus]PAF16265.1 dihydropteroate synthase [Terribacillus saccharophilus]